MRKMIDDKNIWRPTVKETDFLDILDDQLSVCDKISEIPENESVVNIYMTYFGKLPSVYMTRSINYILDKHRNRIAKRFSRKNLHAYLKYCDDCQFYGLEEYANDLDFMRWSEWLLDK